MTSQETIRRIADLARSRRFDDAAIMAATARRQFAGDPVFFALAGAAEFHRGQFARAADYLAEAPRLRPADITVRANLAESHYRCGCGPEALALRDEASARADRTLRLARTGAALAQEAEEFDKAVALYRLVVAAEPKDWSAWNNLGNALIPRR